MTTVPLIRRVIPEAPAPPIHRRHFVALPTQPDIEGEGRWRGARDGEEEAAAELRAAVGRLPELEGMTPHEAPPLPTCLLRLSTASPRHGHSILSAPRPSISTIPSLSPVHADAMSATLAEPFSPVSTSRVRGGGIARFASEGGRDVRTLRKGRPRGRSRVMPCPDGAVEPPPPSKDQLKPLARHLDLTLVPLPWP
jgi:hypothetical protein